MPDMKYVKRIFGGDLTTVVKAQKSLIPMVVEKCVKEIELRGKYFKAQRPRSSASRQFTFEILSTGPDAASSLPPAICVGSLVMNVVY